MDPNAALAEIRELVKRENDDQDGSWAIAAVERFEALDKWITDGGFLPADWQRGTNAG